MKVLAICEAPPTVDERAGDGSTLISREILARLPVDIDLDVLYFDDRDVAVDDSVSARCERVTSLPMRPATAGFLTLPIQRHPRATWLRTTRQARDAVASWSVDADVTYVHGLHAFALVPASRAPVVVNEVDPWSVYWQERARGKRLAGAAYDRLQARRAARLEVATSAIASRYIVVNAIDGQELATRLGRPVDVLPNGVTRSAPSVDECRTGHVVAFVGTLDYAPNIDAAQRLARDVLPELRRIVPDASVVIAGRRPTDEVLALAGPAVEVRADVPSVAEVFAEAAVAAYPTAIGRGTKNSVFEALAAGCPVVATSAAASGIEPGPHLEVVVGPGHMAARLAALLTDDDARSRAARSARGVAASRPGWDDVARQYAELLVAAVSDRGRRPHS